jgi:hypothetical protein
MHVWSRTHTQHFRHDDNYSFDKPISTSCSCCVQHGTFDRCSIQCSHGISTLRHFLDAFCASNVAGPETTAPALQSVAADARNPVCWKQGYAAASNNSFNRSHSQVATAYNMIYFAGSDGMLYAVSLATQQVSAFGTEVNGGGATMRHSVVQMCPCLQSMIQSTTHSMIHGMIQSTAHSMIVT